MSAPRYTAITGGAIALTAATAKCVLGVKAHANSGLLLHKINYGFDGRSRIQLEAKKDLKKRGKPSPDRADSLALSFVAEAVRKVEAFKTVTARPVAKRRVVWSK